MEKKQGFFSVLREEVARGLSPSQSRGRLRSESPRRRTLPVAELFLFSRRWKRHGIAGELVVARSWSLTPLMEGPKHAAGEDTKKEHGWGQWVKDQLSRASSASPSASSFRRSDLRMRLGIMAAPLTPIHACSIDPLPHLSIKDTPIIRISSFSDLLHLLTRFVLVETSSAQYILQQYIAASGGFKLLSSIRNTYSMGKVRMVATEFETATRITKNRNPTRDAESSGFVLCLTPFAIVCIIIASYSDCEFIILDEVSSW
ncbi:uncharacterized protein LOC122043708 [Zingiber officinale]|uniref:uncharacterized protein LOC122043708 n=1 Tax=Zingiber officinale TaxID=94328 RepID=UPI001C4D1059|nr:uncharacterized protein LOC122043708 [Zingiber officinale]